MSDRQTFWHGWTPIDWVVGAVLLVAGIVLNNVSPTWLNILMGVAAYGVYFTVVGKRRERSARKLPTEKWTPPGGPQPESNS